MSKIRKVYKNDFTIVSTSMYRDKHLTFKLRGLLGTMMSLPDDWDFSIAGLAALTDDGESSVRSGLKQLEKLGYLKRERILDKGKIVDWVYHFSDYPAYLDNSTSEGGNNGGCNNKELGQKPLVENQQLENPHVENCTQLNIQKENIQEENISIYNDDDNISGIYSGSAAFENPVVVNDDLTDSFSNGSIEGDILSENMAYDCFEDEQFDRFKEDCKESLDDFNKAHKNMKTPSLYRFKDIAMDWIRAKEIYQSDEYVTKAEKMLGKVMNSFAKNNDRRVIASLDKKDLKMLFKAGVDYYDPNSDSEIKNLQKWYAGTLRNMIQNA